MVDFNAVIDKLESIGFYSIFLPFLLVYVVIFGILEKSKIFNLEDKKQGKNINAIISFVFALFVVASIKTVMYIQSLIINIVVFIIFILCILILLGFVMGESYTEIFKNKYVKWGTAGIILIITTAVLGQVLGIWEYINENLSLGNSDTWINIIVILVIIGILVWVTKSDEKDKIEKKD